MSNAEIIRFPTTHTPEVETTQKPRGIFRRLGDLACTASEVPRYRLAAALVSPRLDARRNKRVKHNNYTPLRVVKDESSKVAPIEAKPDQVQFIEYPDTDTLPTGSNEADNSDAKKAAVSSVDNYLANPPKPFSGLSPQEVLGRIRS